MKKLNCYKVTFSDGSGIISEKSSYEKTVVDVIGENEMNIVINDIHFTTISKKKESYCSSIGVPSIRSYTNDACFGNRVDLTLYTTKNVRPQTIQRMIKDHISNKYGFFLNNKLDLSFIK